MEFDDAGASNQCPAAGSECLAEPLSGDTLL